ncbi:MAG TPA: flagellar motor protein MotB [Kofleriaceae bacterium]|jgi:chemotaxis protein MotB
MAKFDTDEIGKPGKPPRARRFPWRLWLFALVMTAGTAAGGYYAWQYRHAAQTADETVAGCRADLAKVKPQIDEATKKYTGCNALLDSNNKLIDANKKKAAELDIQLTAISNNLNASKDELAALTAQRAEAEKRLTAISDIQKQFAKMIDTGQLKVTARRGSLVLSLPSEVLFPSGIADLSKPGELAVLEVGITLKRFPERRFLVVGHTDDVPLKSSTYKDNWELSTARALTVTRFLVQAGMDPRNLVAAGAGEHDPVSKDRAKNRRIEIALLPAINELPPLPASLGDDSARAAIPAEKPPAPPAASPAAAAPAPPAAAPTAAPTAPTPAAAAPTPSAAPAPRASAPASAPPAAKPPAPKP